MKGRKRMLKFLILLLILVLVKGKVLQKAKMILSFSVGLVLLRYAIFPHHVLC